jgi:hypothetical protein
MMRIWFSSLLNEAQRSTGRAERQRPALSI